MAQGAIARASEISVVGVTYHYSGAALAALAGIDLTVGAGESIALVGPEQAGKSTLLQLLAGRERPTQGQVLLDGEEIAGLPPSRCPVAAVFGRYSLFPFLDVAANVAFGLRAGAPDSRRRALAMPAGRAGAARRVREALEAVRMGDYARRRPPQLSPAHQQRVAIARALVLRPRVLLLDAPLAGIDDEALRLRLAEDLRALHRQLGITLVYATRSGDEASAVADRVAVLSAGRMLLEACPAEDATVHPEHDPAADVPSVGEPILGASDAPDAGAPAA
jgi:spermidine/putrescine transport system ATP-binding protein